jgi:adenylosuccinate lyase
MNLHETYQSPLATRNASPAMGAIWSAQRKFSTWRQLWLALAEAQRELGLSITDSQLRAMRDHLDDIPFDRAAALERELRHDVMAHIHAWGEQIPDARPIIHLGATSQFVNCNTELLQIRQALDLIAGKLAGAIDALGTFAARYRDLPTLGFTHLQPAQPTTVGKRAAMWAQDLSLGLEEIEHRLASLRFRGVKGTTGTQASFLALFGGDIAEAHEKVEQLDRLVTEKMGWPADRRFVLTGQTYPRVVDAMVGASLATVAAACAKFATDMRLLASRKELEEPFERSQVGSSAMAYKRNPMRCERICGLSRFVIGMTTTPLVTAAEQWMERTLDDSSARRLSLPEPFLALDGVLDILNNVARGMVVYEKTIGRNLAAELPFMATENLMMAAVQQGADRQTVHELIRSHAQAAAQRVKGEAADNDLLERLAKEPAFANVDLDAELDGSKFIGRAPQQVDRFIEQVVQPIRQRYADRLNHDVSLRV